MLDKHNYDFLKKKPISTFDTANNSMNVPTTCWWIFGKIKASMCVFHSSRTLVEMCKSSAKKHRKLCLKVGHSRSNSNKSNRDSLHTFSFCLKFLRVSLCVISFITFTVPIWFQSYSRKKELVVLLQPLRCLVVKDLSKFLAQEETGENSGGN